MGKFKLIAGLGNNDKNKVKDLVLLYKKAGADIFDISPEIFEYVQQEYIKAGFDLSSSVFCVSVPVSGDIHGKKVKINPKLCKKCNKCKKYCIQKAIEPPFVKEEKCIGCLNCLKKTSCKAIESYDNKSSNFEKLINSNAKIDIVEVHISTKDKKIIKTEFKNIIKKLEDRNCAVSVCLNRQFFSNTKSLKILDELKNLSKGRTFMVQADGKSMNSGNETLAGTIEAVAFGLFLSEYNFDITLSGGTNSYTAKLAKEAGLDCSVAFGSYARKIVDDKDEPDALDIAANFVKQTKEILND